MRIRPGNPYPLGATVTPEGVQFAVWSSSATTVEVCLFDTPDGPETARLTLPGHTDQIFHGLALGLRAGQLYGLRAQGPWNPAIGHRFNPHRLLVDPYARAICGRVDHQHLGGHAVDRAPAAREGRDASRPRRHHKTEEILDERDTAAAVPRGVVVDDRFDWGDDAPPRTPWSDTVIYELHVKGFTARHPEVPPELRGTFAGLGHPAVLDYLRDLGVTAVELLPVMHHVDEAMLAARGLTNYWGYQTLGWFAPDARFSPARMGQAGGQVIAFKEMVKALHRAGLEVILDVVYNHGCEGGEGGPTLSLRGLDNAGYFRLAEDKRRYDDATGCGNTLALRNPPVLRLVMDSLRYWAEEMHVDGFRFDLGVALGRVDRNFDYNAPFFHTVAQDPVLARCKLIAEPWDLGPAGYRVGGFPLGWSEWNGKYRDGVRRFWAGTDRFPRELAWRLTGSSDLFDGRGTRASVNFVTCHDGFTVADLVSYERKRNLDNLEDNRDGTDDNDAWNCGVEGPTDDWVVGELRGRQRRNLLGTLLLSAGVPMLLAGDERGHSQGGNNNAYCQDNETTWIDWETRPAQRRLHEYVRALLKLRRGHPSLRRSEHFRGVVQPGHFRKDLSWIAPDGREMVAADWSLPGQTLAALIDGEDPILLVLNGERQAARFVLPTCDGVDRWRAAITSRQPDDPAGTSHAPGDTIALLPLDLLVFVAS